MQWEGQRIMVQSSDPGCPFCYQLASCIGPVAVPQHLQLSDAGVSLHALQGQCVCCLQVSKIRMLGISSLAKVFPSL